MAISQGQHAISEAIQGQGLAHNLAFKPAGAVRRFPVAKSADNKQRVAGVLHVIYSQRGQRLHPYRQAGCLQLPGGLPGQLLGKAALAGEADQP